MKKIIEISFVVVAMGMAVYQLAYTQILIQDPIGHRVTHLGLAILVVLLALLLESKKSWLLKWLLFLGSLAFALYFEILLDQILTFRSALPFTSDLIMGGIGMAVVFTTTYLVYGKGLPIVGGVLLIYLFLGRYLPYPFTVADVSFERLLVWLTIPGPDEGIFGDILDISAKYLFLFIIFGSALHAFGGLRFIMGVGQWFGSKMKAGPAAMPVFSDILLGEVTGSTVLSVVITGSYTIPLMKKAGYLPEQAAAIEALTSNGGQIMPPVMGATAFVMAGYIGVPYFDIAIAAIVPAFLYYFGVALYVYFLAEKMDIKPVVQSISGKQLLREAPLFLIPLGVLALLLARGYPLPSVAFWSIMTAVVSGLINSIRKETRLNFSEVMKTLTDGVKTGGEVAVVCALISAIGTSIKVSGLGIKLPLAIVDLCHGYLIIALFIAMISSILLGMGVPTTAAYILVAIGAVPVLLQMGVPLLAAHFFCFIFACYSHITPPVALGVMVAAKIAGANFWRTGWESIKAGFTAFLLPFWVIYTPVVILRPEGGLFLSIVQIIIIMIAISSLQIFLSKYCFFYLRLYERIGFLIASLFCIIGTLMHNYSFVLAGIGLFAVNIAWHFMRVHSIAQQEVGGKVSMEVNENPKRPRKP